MAESKYNGCHNRNTWLYNRWLRQEKCTFDYWYDLTRQYYHFYDQLSSITYEAQHPAEYASYKVARLLEEELQEWILDTLPDSNFLHDLIFSAAQEIDYDEIAKGFLEDYLEDMKI